MKMRCIYLQMSELPLIKWFVIQTSKKIQASVRDINIYQFEVEKGWILVLLKGAPGKNNDEKIRTICWYNAFKCF